MYPDRKTALSIIEEMYPLNPGDWYEHSFVTAQCAERIAAACSMDTEKAFVFGLLHDIGRSYGLSYLAHIIRGYDLLMDKGYDEAARICLTHSFQTQKMTDFFGHYDVTPEDLVRIRTFIASCVYDDYDRLIQLCDSIAMAKGPVTPEIRMSDIRRRYGTYPQDKWDKTISLQRYFEHRAGRALMDIVADTIPGSCGCGLHRQAAQQEK